MHTEVHLYKSMRPYNEHILIYRRKEKPTPFRGQACVKIGLHSHLLDIDQLHGILAQQFENSGCRVTHIVVTRAAEPPTLDVVRTIGVLGHLQHMRAIHVPVAVLGNNLILASLHQHVKPLPCKRSDLYH